MVEMGELRNERRDIYVGIGRIDNRKKEGRAEKDIWRSCDLIIIVKSHLYFGIIEYIFVIN